jgi:hypothetical protein
MQEWIVVAAVIIVIAILLYVFVFSRPTDTTMEVILPSGQSGKTEMYPSSKIFRAFNQPDGAVFSYAFWITVNDFTFNYGRQRVIFSKNDAPGVYLDSTPNAMLIKMNTFGGNQETVLIPNIPAQKWIHVVVEVNQYALNIFINGILRQTHTMSALPLQNTDSLVVGSSQSGYDGTIAELTYYARTLKPGEIERLAKDEPSSSSIMPSMPPYSDLGWYIGPFKSA